MKNKKLLIYLPDGVGLRNFIFTNFIKTAQHHGYEVEVWNNTPLLESGFDVPMHMVPQPKLANFTDIIKAAYIQAQLLFFAKKFKSNVYTTYIFKNKAKTLKSRLKNLIKQLMIAFAKDEKPIRKLMSKAISKEKSTTYFDNCKKQLKDINPSVLFCTNQRPVTAIAPIEAAKSLGIPTVSFIFSWDNLPKATMIIKPDFYFVWSDYMKNELLKYYPYVDENQVSVTGTPQFEPHFNQNLVEIKTSFFDIHNLDANKKYICFSGDDVTTSPDDQDYLRDICEAIRYLNNNKNENIGVIFRPCPVDHSGRYNEVLQDFTDIIAYIPPKWKQQGDSWDTVVPTKEDIALQVNTIKNSELVINIASSMVFDFVSMKKPCLYINYLSDTPRMKGWHPKKIYNFVHFQSMPNKDAVIWLNTKEEIADKILEGLNNPQKYVANAQKWFEVINQQPADQASERIVKAINQIIKS